MATPISNTGSTSISHSKATRSEEQSSRAGGQAASEGAVPAASEDALSVSRAAELLSSEPADRGQGVIQSAEQASQMAQGLKDLFAQQPGQAIAAQAKNLSPEMAGLLKAG